MDLSELRSLGVLALVDIELARTLARLSDADPEVALAIALTNRNVRLGHSCFPLGADPKALWPSGEAPASALPERSRWNALLRESSLTDEGPLVLDAKGRLYLRRYWQLEDDIASNLAARARVERRFPRNPAWNESTLHRLFPGEADSPQRQAARNALEHSVSLLCGGPGTGKTTTVAAIVALLAERALHENGSAPRVMLLAPTGKAAARLGEAVHDAKGRIDASAEVLSCIPTEAATVHRALGMHRAGLRFRRGADFPLDADIIVLDEASMIDLALMRQLLEATPPTATLLVVGDPDQLTSVEAGSVLRDLVEASEQTWWRGRVARLTKTWRYDEDQALGRLIRAVRAGEVSTVDALLSPKEEQSFVWSPSERLSVELDAASARWSDILATVDPAEHFRRRTGYVLLTPFRRGPIGTRVLGQKIRERMEARGHAAGILPIIIERNDRELGVFNGDFVMLVDGDPPTAHLPGEGAEHRAVAEARLPSYSTAFALSVHKSQGSEFDELLLVLPDEDTPLLTRELLYTALSRAKQRVRLIGSKEVVRAAIERRARRDSGLVDALDAHAPR